MDISYADGIIDVKGIRKSYTGISIFFREDAGRGESVPIEEGVAHLAKPRLLSLRAEGEPLVMVARGLVLAHSLLGNR